MITTDADDLRALVEECEEFSRCEDCGTHVVNLGAHRCQTSTEEPGNTRSARRARASRDPRSDDDRVGIYRRTLGNTYAYHELDDGEIYCGCNEYTKADELVIVSRSEAKSLGRCPCGNCERLQSLRGAGD